MTQLLHALSVWAHAHPLQVIAYAIAFASFVNGLLPARLKGGLVMRAINVALDRASVLTRSDAPGTLKWPLITASVLRTVADSIDPPPPPPGGMAVTRSERITFAPPLPAPVAIPPAKRWLLDLTFATACLGMLVALVITALGCHATSDAVLAMDPSVPSTESCLPGEQVCRNGAPYVCSPSANRFWPVLPPQSTGAPGMCGAIGCTVEHPTLTSSLAHCGPAADGGVQ